AVAGRGVVRAPGGREHRPEVAVADAEADALERRDAAVVGRVALGEIPDGDRVRVGDGLLASVGSRHASVGKCRDYTSALAVYCRRMSVEAAGEAPVAPVQPPRLNRWVTGAALAVLAVLAALVFWPPQGLDTLDRPEQSLERVVARDMEVRAAAVTAPAWERWLDTLAFSSDAAARADAIAWY